MMKESKDIFDQFKNNEHKLDKRPANSVWNRLEGRLDNHERPAKRPRRAPRIMRNWFSMAGVLLVLVACISALSLIFRNQSVQTAMKQENATPRFVLEEIGIYSDQNKTAQDIGDYAKQLNRLNTNPILEGDASKELRVQQTVLTSNKIRKSKNSNKNLKLNQNKQLALANKKEQRLAASPQSAPPKEVATYDMSYDLSVEGMEADDAIVFENGNADSAPIASATINDFLWLIGRWESPRPNNNFTEPASRKKVKDKVIITSITKEKTTEDRSVEEWKQIDVNTLIGDGYLLIDGQKSFSEQMRIEQIDNELYYILSLGAKEEQRKYKLKSVSQEEVVFENTKLDFPNQVVLQSAKSGGRFTVLLQNNSPTQLDPKLHKYFQQRNEINTEQIKRVMTKVQ